MAGGGDKGFCRENALAKRLRRKIAPRIISLLLAAGSGEGNDY
jgi:hypothetical protein